MNPRALIIDPDFDYQALLKNALEKVEFKVFQLTQPSQYELFIEKNRIQYVFLEMELDGDLGLAVCERLRSQFGNSIFIWLVSEKTDEYLKIAALNAGADDFLEKPFSKRYALAKVSAWLRAAQKDKIEREGGLQIDKESYLVYFKGKAHVLPKKEFELIQLFSQKPNKVLSRDFIRNTIWCSSEQVNNRTVDVYIRKIRSKLGADIIQTIKGVGYKL